MIRTLLEAERIVWEANHGRGSYTARVYVRIKGIHRKYQFWMAVERDYSRGMARKWRATCSKVDGPVGAAFNSAAIGAQGYGKTRDDAVYRAVDQMSGGRR